MKTVLKLAAGLCIVLTLALAIGLFALAAGWFNPRLRAYAEGTLSRNLGAEVHIGRLSGNPLSHLRLEEVRIGPESAFLLSLDALDLRYRLLPLLRGAVAVDTLRLIAPHVALRQNASGTWDLPIQEAPAETSQPWWESGSPLSLRIVHAEITDGEISLQTPGATTRVRELSLALGFNADAAGYRLELRRFRTLLFAPPLPSRTSAGLPCCAMAAWL